MDRKMIASVMKTSDLPGVIQAFVSSPSSIDKQYDYQEYGDPNCDYSNCDQLKSGIKWFAQ